jgi:hypothetical protein
MSRACNTYGREEEGKRPLDDLDIGGRIILE